MQDHGLFDSENFDAVIKVIGIGGGGCNAVNHMVKHGIHGVDFICANTDIGALNRCEASTLLPLGKGPGAAGVPEIGRRSALESRECIQDALQGAEMVFIIASLGGGTGTGAAPVVADIAHKIGLLVVAIVIMPFGFEGYDRNKAAEAGLGELVHHVDLVITIPNEKLLSLFDNNMSLLNCFNKINDAITHAVQGIAGLITDPGFLIVDYADLNRALSEMGEAMFGSGISNGSERAREAAEMALRDPLLNDVNLTDAGSILLSITAGSGLTIGEFEEASSMIHDLANENAIVKAGTIISQDMQENLRVTLLVTGFKDKD